MAFIAAFTANPKRSAAKKVDKSEAGSANFRIENGESDQTDRTCLDTYFASC